MTYVLTLAVFYFLSVQWRCSTNRNLTLSSYRWKNWAEMVALRWQWFRSDEYQNTLHARSLIVSVTALSSKHQC